MRTEIINGVYFSIDLKDPYIFLTSIEIDTARLPLPFGEVLFPAHKNPAGGARI